MQIISNSWVDILADMIDSKRIVRDHDKQLHMKTFDSIEEKDSFYEKPYLPKLPHEIKIEKLKSLYLLKNLNL